jgi:hypothetical protein
VSMRGAVISNETGATKTGERLSQSSGGWPGERGIYAGAQRGTVIAILGHLERGLQAAVHFLPYDFSSPGG